MNVNGKRETRVAVIVMMLVDAASRRNMCNAFINDCTYVNEEEKDAPTARTRERRRDSEQTSLVGCAIAA